MSIPGPTCSVCAVLDRIDPEQAEALRAHLANPAWRYADLAAALHADSDGEIALTPYQLSWHANGRCAAHEALR